MKKLQIFVCVLLMLCLAACGNTDSGITTGTSADTKPEVTTEKTKNVSETTESGEPFSPDQPVVDAFSYVDLADLTFTFSSGVGGWQTTLYIRADGSFTGEYFDSDMGVTGEGYPDGTVYVCTFNGQFAPLSQIDDLTYTTTVESISMRRRQMPRRYATVCAMSIRRLTDLTTRRRCIFICPARRLQI